VIYCYAEKSPEILGSWSNRDGGCTFLHDEGARLRGVNHDLGYKAAKKYIQEKGKVYGKSEPD
jgi:hypothetical protein